MLSAKLLTNLSLNVSIHRGRIKYDIGQRIFIKALYHIIVFRLIYSYTYGEELSFHLYEL